MRRAQRGPAHFCSYLRPLQHAGQQHLSKCQDALAQQVLGEVYCSTLGQADPGLAVWAETQEAAATAAAMCHGSVPMDLVPRQPFLAGSGQRSMVPPNCGHLGDTGKGGPRRDSNEL